MKFTILYKLGTALKDWAERTGHPIIKGIGYKLRGIDLEVKNIRR